MATGIPAWHKCDLTRKELRGYSRRSDAAGLVQYGGYFAVLGALAWSTVAAWGTLWAVPAFVAYATVYGFATAFMHECHHGTPFRSRWLNEAAHVVLSVMAMKERVRERWKHTHHHTYTLVTAEDLEIQSGRPPRLWRMAVDLWRIPTTIDFTWYALRAAVGSPDPDARAFVPASEHRRLVRSSMLYVAVCAGIVAWAVAAQSWLPVALTFGARIAGAWANTLLSLTQHVGLPENTADHRLNSRTIHMNPVLRFLYCNMNYHVEHHMYPMVPFHALPALHRRLKDQMPPAYPSTLAAWAEMLPTLWRQRRDPGHSAHRPLPAALAAE